MAKAFWDKETEIVTVEKNKSENINIKLCEKNEKSYIDIRISKVDKDQVYHPTVHGVAIPYEQWNTIVKKILELKVK